MNLGLTLDWSTVTSIALPLLIGVAYFVRVGHLRETSRQPSVARQASFACGMSVIVLTTVGPMDELADDFVFGHMIQHTLLLDEASLLLALGLTGPVLGPVLGKPGVGRLRLLTHPIAAVGLWLVVMYGWHAPPLYQAAEENELIHLLEHASFVAAGVTMWLALLGPFPKPDWFGNGARAVYVGAVHFSSMGLANILMWSGTVLYPFYAASDRAHGLEPLGDQSIAGVILMVAERRDHAGDALLAGHALGRPGHRAPGAARPRLRTRDRARSPARAAGGGRGSRGGAAPATRSPVTKSRTRAERRSAMKPSRVGRALRAGRAALAAALVAGCLALAGCGGGGGSATASTPPAIAGGDAVPAKPAPPLGSPTTAATGSTWPR